jgi:putative endonuclease
MNRVDGKIGEDLALDYLLAKGLRLRERNWRCSHLEVDLIMEDETFLHIVEVRSRTAPYMVSPLDSVNREKQRRLFRAASAYVKRHNIDKEVIFDIVTITYEEDSHYIEYHKGALIPLYV